MALGTDRYCTRVGLTEQVCEGHVPPVEAARPSPCTASGEQPTPKAAAVTNGEALARAAVEGLPPAEDLSSDDPVVSREINRHLEPRHEDIRERRQGAQREGEAGLVQAGTA